MQQSNREPEITQTPNESWNFGKTALSVAQVAKSRPL